MIVHDQPDYSIPPEIKGIKVFQQGDELAASAVASAPRGYVSSMQI